MESSNTNTSNSKEMIDIQNQSSSAIISIPTNTTLATNALQPASKSTLAQFRTKPIKNVLDEDTYVDTLDKIIQRDFFPDLPKLRTQLEWLEAEQTRNVGKMREIHLRLRLTQRETPSFTPASFTPSTSIPSTSNPIPPTSSTSSSSSTVSDDVSLDSFLNRNTSEDNAAFDVILDKVNMKKQHKYGWLYEQEAEAKLLLTNEGIAGTQRHLGWEYKAKNALMYNVDGVAHSDKEEKLIYAGNPKEIVRQNTRFDGQTGTTSNFGKTKQDKEAQQIYEVLGKEEQEIFNARRNKNAKVYLDEIRGYVKAIESPSVRGYGFVMTPSPAPGVDASPFTTWGSIDGTPMMLDPSSTPGPIGGPTFSIPETSRREQVAMNLADKATASFKSPKNIPLKRIATPKRSGNTPNKGTYTPRSPMTTDFQLRKSYSTTPTKLGVIASPISKRSTPISSPSIVVTPKSRNKRINRTPIDSLTNNSTPTTSSSLTDNLLKI